MRSTETFLVHKQLMNMELLVLHFISASRKWTQLSVDVAVF